MIRDVIAIIVKSILIMLMLGILTLFTWLSLRFAFPQKTLKQIVWLLIIGVIVGFFVSSLLSLFWISFVLV